MQGELVGWAAVSPCVRGAQQFHALSLLALRPGPEAVSALLFPVAPGLWGHSLRIRVFSHLVAYNSFKEVSVTFLRLVKIFQVF